MMHVPMVALAALVSAFRKDCDSFAIAGCMLFEIGDRNM